MPIQRHAVGHETRTAVWLGLGLLAFAVIIHLPTLDQPLLETQSFRQTHTAYNALIFYQEGIDLLRPQLPVFGEPFVFPIEFPLFQALASLVMTLGAAPDVAVRATALACFVATGLLVWRLLVRVSGPAAGLAGLAAFLLSPLGLLVGRMSLIEYLATAGSLGFVLAAFAWHERGGSRWFWLALAAGAVGMLVKPTTAFMYLVPVLALGLSAWRQGRTVASTNRHYWVGLACLVALPVLLGGAWTIYADGVRAANPATAWFTASAGLSGYYFGTIEQRLDPSTWWDLIGQAEDLLFGHAIWLWALVAIAAAMVSRRRGFLLALTMSGALGPIVFTNQYVIPGQEYYLAAVSPFAALVVGLASSWLWKQRRRSLSVAVMASLLIGWAVTLHLSQGYWGRQFAGVHDLDQILPAVDVVVSHSATDELVVLAGQDWNPAVLYYARRKGFMVRGALTPQLTTELREAGYRTLFYCPPRRGLPAPCDVTDL